METVVLVFEREEDLCLEAFSLLFRDIPVSLRVFPLFISREKIIKRWALVKKDTWYFAEREEKAETLQQFAQGLRNRPCFILVDPTADYGLPCYFLLDTSNKTSTLYMDGISIEQKKAASVRDAAEMAVLTLYNVQKVVLRNIKLKSKQGQKETLVHTVYVENAPIRLPSEVFQCASVPDGAVCIGTYPAHISHPVIRKVLAKCPIYFSGDRADLGLQMGEGGICAHITKSKERISVLDASAPDIREHYNRLFASQVLKKHGAAAEIFLSYIPMDRARVELQQEVEEAVAKIKSEETEKKVEHAAALAEILGGVSFPRTDKRSKILSAFSKLYADLSASIEKDAEGEKKHIFTAVRNTAPSNSLYRLLQ